MRNLVSKVALLVLLVSTATGCTSMLAYTSEIKDPASPEDKHFVFSLRNSTIILSLPASNRKSGDGKQAAGQSEDTSPVDTCAEERAKGMFPLANDPLNKCLSGVTAKAVASRDSVVYDAKPWYGTTVTTKVVDTDPLMVTSIAVNYKNPAVAIVSSAGAGAVAGFAIGGPWGAAIGGVIGGAGALAKEVVPVGAELEKKPGLPPPDVLFAEVCDEDKYDKNGRLKKIFEDLMSNDKPQLVLPVALSYETSKSLTQCWHPLPNNITKADEAQINTPAGAIPEIPLSGWFYQIGLIDPKDSKLPPVLPRDPENKLGPPFEKRNAYFSKKDFSTGQMDWSAAYQETFPVSACRAVELQITWWERMAERVVKVDNTWKRLAEPVASVKHKMMVADSDYIQAVRLPKAGTVYLLPVCGGYASPTQSSSSLGDLIDAIIKQAQAVKDAQDKYKKNSK